MPVSTKTQLTGENHTVSMDFTETDIPENPVHYNISNSHYTEWSYVYFGTYPQTEVVGDTEE